jgi:hypothetical protein
MSAITFPATPTVGAKHTVGTRAWVWDGAKWNLDIAAPPAVLPGLGGWAEVSDAPTSTYTDASGVKWNVWTFAANGTLTVTAQGLLDVLAVGGGAYGKGIYPGNAGALRQGLMLFPLGALAVTVGAGGITNDATHVGLPTSVGGVFSTAPATQAANAIYALGSGGTIGNYQQGYTSSITGASVVYGLPGQGSPRPNRGDGSLDAAGAADGTTRGASGVFIVRRPA